MPVFCYLSCEVDGILMKYLELNWSRYFFIPSQFDVLGEAIGVES